MLRDAVRPACTVARLHNRADTGETGGGTSCEGKEDWAPRLSVERVRAPTARCGQPGPLWPTPQCSPQERLHRPLRLQHCSPRWEELPKSWLDRPPAEEKPHLKLSAGSSRSTRNPTTHRGECARLTRGDALTAHPAPAKGTGHSGLYEDTPHVWNE